MVSPPNNGGNVSAAAAYHAEMLKAGAECFAAALDDLRRGWSPLANCEPDHIGVRRLPGGHKCNSPGKRPWHGWLAYQNRRPTEAEIRDWWNRLPNSNVGIALGPVSGVVRVDVDGAMGAARFRELCGGEPPPTLEFTSGQNDAGIIGRGFLYAIPAGVAIKTTTNHSGVPLHDELRVQTQGAQTVLPPSRHLSGRRYQWVQGRGPGEIEAALMPAWMIEMMRVEPRPKREPTGRTATADTDEVAYAKVLLAALKKERADDYETWVKVGMALHSVDDSDDMLTVFDEWSKQSDKWEEDGCAVKWESFSNDRENGVTLGSLVFWAKEDGWTPPQAKRSASASENTTAPRGQAAPDANGAASRSEPPTDGLGVILADFHARLRPKFRRGQNIFSEAIGREVKPAEGCFAPDRHLLALLASAVDAPKHGQDDNRQVDRKRLPEFYRDWARPAWQEMLNGLLEEAETGEVIATAEEEFRHAIRSGLHTQITLGHEDKDPQRYSLIDWAEKFAKVGAWKQVRSYLLWCRREAEGQCASVAVRVELFGQVNRNDLAKIGHRKFAALCELYGIGQSVRAGHGGKWTIELTTAFLQSVREGPNDG